MSATGTILAGAALKYGAPILAELLKRKGGKGGAIAGTAIKTIAEKLGTEPTQKAVADKFREDPETVGEVMRSVNEDLAAMAGHASDATKSYHQLVLGDSQSKSLLNRIWRPVNGLLFGLEVSFIIFVVGAKIWNNDANTLLALKDLFMFIGTVLGTHAGVVGVYVWGRTTEKLGSAT